MPSYKNRVGCAVSGTPGTGTITLAAALPTYQSLATAYGADALVDVVIEDGDDWEVCRDCTYTHSGTTLTRGTLEESSTGSRLSLTSSATVKVVIAASRVASSAAYPVRYPSITKWTAAKARGASNPPRVIILGDSNTVGAAAGTGTIGLVGGRPLGFINLMAAALGWNNEALIGDQNTSASSVAYTSYDTRVTYGSGWASANAFGNLPASGPLGANFFTAAGGATGKIGFTPAAAFDKLDVWSAINTGLATLTVYIDGASVGTINQSGTAAFTKSSYTVSRATHTIEFGIGASGTGYVGFVSPWDSTANVPVVYSAGWSGARMTHLVGATSPWNYKPAATAVLPDLAIIYCTINEINDAVAVNTHIANLYTLISAVQVTADVVLMIGYPGSPSGTTDGLLDRYALQYMAVAHDLGCGFFDSRSVFGSSNTIAQAKGYRADNSHPNSAGHTALAAALVAYLRAAGIT